MRIESKRPESLVRDEAQVCANGHVVNWFSKWATSQNKEFCPECGSKTQISCIECKTPIPGGVRHLGLTNLETGERDTVFREPGRSIPAHCSKCGAAFPWAGKQSRRSPARSVPEANIIIGSPGANINAADGSIHQDVAWVKHINQHIDKASGSEEEKKEAKSLWERVSENRLLNTVIGAAFGELTKAVLSHK